MDHLDALAIGRAARTTQRPKIRPFVADHARTRPDQPHYQAPERGLAATAFAHNGQYLPAVQAQADVVYCIHLGMPAPPATAALELHTHVFQFQQWVGHPTAPPCPANGSRW